MFRSTKPLIGTPRDAQKNTQTFEFTPIGDENRHGSHAMPKSATHKSTSIHGLINKKNRNPLHTNNSPLTGKLRGGSSFMDESEYDSIQHTNKQQQVSSSSPVTNAFHNNGHQDLLNTGSNPVRQQQEDISKLKSENYNLKVKIASLTKYLNAVTNHEQQYIYEENSKLQEQLIVLRDEVAQLNQELANKENQPQQRQMSDHSEQYKEEIHRLKSLVRDLEASEEEKEQLKDTLRDLQQLNHELQDELEEQQQQKAKMSSPVSKSYVARLEEEIEEMKDLVEDKNAEIRRRDEELDEKDEELDKLQVQVRELEHMSHHDSAAETQIDELKHQLDQREDQLKKQQKHLHSLENELDHLNQQLADSQTHSENLKSVLNATEKKLAHLQDELANRSTGEHSSEEIRRLQNEKFDLEAKLESVQAKFRESKSIISEQKQIIDEFKETETVVDELKREREHLKLKIEQLERESERTYKAYKDVKKLLDQSKVKKTDNEDIWKSEVDLLSSKVKELNMENDKLYQDLEREKESKTLNNESYAKLEVKSLTAKCNDLQMELADKENALHRLTSQYQRELDRYDSALEQKEKELSKTRDELRSIKMSTVQQIDDEKIELIKLKGSKESQIKLLQIELENLKEQHKMEVDALKSHMERMKKSSRSLGDDLISDKTLDNNKELLQKITEKNSRIRYLNEKLTEALLTLKETQTRLTRLEVHKSDLQDDNDRLEAKLIQMSEKLQLYKREMQKFADERVSDAELADLKLQVRLLEKENMEQKSAKHELSDKYTLLSEENALLQRRIDKIVDKYRQLQGSMNQSGSLSSRTLATLQGKVDYYKMKHTKAIYQVKDLKFMNSFMKMSIRATNNHIKQDIKKLQDVGIYPDYDLICKKKPTLKVLMMFVLAAVRIKRKTEFGSIRNKKIELLEMKVMD